MVQVRVEQGVLEGNQKQGVFRFRGVPYAAPPVGDLRWAAPQPPAAWDGVRDATAFGNAAIQILDTGADLGARQSEDCLYLNVWSASLDPQTRQPVMVWIHGGGFLNGAASMPDYHGAAIAQRGVTYVSLNYRLGAFGFVHHPEAGGNTAVQDWVAALDWLSRNITAFGGDPGNVTVFGQSAGAVAARALLATPAARGLFHRAILQSAGFERHAAMHGWGRERVVEASARMFEQLGGSDLEQLRQVPAEQVRQASRLLSGIRPAPGEVHTPANLVWFPTEDGQVVGEDLSCWPADVPVLFGHTADEARFFITPRGPIGAPPGTVDPARLYTPATLAKMAAVFGGHRGGDIVAQLTGSPYEALAALITAAIWTEPALETYRRFTDLGRTTYCYRFDRVRQPADGHARLPLQRAPVPVRPPRPGRGLRRGGRPGVRHDPTRLDRIRPDRRAERSRRHTLACRHEDSATSDGHRRQDAHLPSEHQPRHRTDQLHSSRHRQMRRFTVQHP